MTDKKQPRGAPPAKGAAPAKKPAPAKQAPKEPRPVPPASIAVIAGSSHDPRVPANKRAYQASPTLAGMTGIRVPKPKLPADDGTKAK